MGTRTWAPKPIRWRAFEWRKAGWTQYRWDNYYFYVRQHALMKPGETGTIIYCPNVPPEIAVPAMREASNLSGTPEPANVAPVTLPPGWRAINLED